MVDVTKRGLFGILAARSTAFARRPILRPGFPQSGRKVVNVSCLLLKVTKKDL